MNLNRIYLILGLFAAGLSPGHAEETWVACQPPGEVSFSVLMPAEAQKKEGRDEWRARDEVDSLYSAARGYYTEPKRIANPDGFMRMMVNRLATNTRSRLAYLWFFKYQYVPSCEFKLVDQANHQVAAGRYFLVNQWFYFLNYTASDKAFDAARMKIFFESFQIINPQLKDFQPGS